MRCGVIRIKQYSRYNTYALVGVHRNSELMDTSVIKDVSAVTAEEKTNKKNNVKARSLLLMAPPQNEQQQYIHTDLEKIHEDDLEAMDLKWQHLTAKYSVFNYHKMVHYARECRAKGTKRFDWVICRRTCSDNRALMVLCRLRATYKRGLATVEEQLITYRNEMRVNYNYTTKRTHPNAQRNMVPRAVLMKTGLKPFNTTRTVNAVHPKSTVYSANPMSCFSKIAQSTVKRPFQPKTVLTNKRFTQKVNTAKAQAVNTARPKAVKTARPNSAVDKTVRGKPQQDDTGFIGSGCSRHNTGNIAYLSDFKEFNGGYVIIGGGALRKVLGEKNSIARTPQQMVILAYSKLPTNILAEAVSTALLSLSFMRPFGCHGTILNTLDSLGKFDGKSDEGFFVGYSLSSKAFRVYNTRTRRVEENLHIGFLENKPMIEENGLKWLFDIHSLTQSMNYVPIVAGTITDKSTGTQEEFNAGTSTQKEKCRYGEPKSAADDQKHVQGGPDNENDEKDKAEDDSSPKEVNVAGQHVNTASLEVNTGSFKLNTVDPSVSTASSNDQDSPKDMFKMGASHTLEATHVEFFSDEDEPEVDLEKPLVKDGDADDVDVKHIEYLMLNASPLKHVKRGLDTKIPQSSSPPIKVGDEAVHKELGDRMERAVTTASSLEAEQDNGSGPRCQVTILELQMLKLSLRLHLNSPMIHLSQELTHLEVERTV
ncbi:putative ribonuclease H-like domain-containing protein [Tanacetum coccineum]